ncbi:class I SAM-dependent methyltransferase [Luteibacter sp. UNCMF366Tsu5.1]|uniref:class I SAM-dependent methyltransferase n=1 Tax=Luteibacter sp. UNCMF366Tsu5.1 TaxID=1502758 RepID=UPI000908C4AA|nr:class I SAM-dependent methyltransferase [Luteibacter sp. UNCMF366Tsu5.1]SFW43537.1 malonyl-CoA O-methyltransferase [Luteibacter sp. UNCMF366Tsu5.1]
MNSVPILAPAEAYALWAADYPAYAHNPVMQAEERAMLALLPTNLQGLSILDAGCGSGRYIHHALARDAARVLGVDLSDAMLARATEALGDAAHVGLMQGSLDALPLTNDVADLTLCGLTIGHLEHLEPALGELCRVTKLGGTILCSDVHPTGHALGWLRDFKAGGRRYAARHTPHLYSHWHAACARLGLAIERVVEPMLDPADIPDGARFDASALHVPVALVFRLRRIDGASPAGLP